MALHFIAYENLFCTTSTQKRWLVLLVVPVLKKFLVNGVTYNLLPEVTVFVIEASFALAIQVAQPFFLTVTRKSGSVHFAKEGHI